MTGKASKKSSSEDKKEGITPVEYTTSERPLDFYVSEKKLSYAAEKPFSIYYDEPEHSVRLLKGDCIKTLNRARENSVDMIFADPPYFLSNGGITCYAGLHSNLSRGYLN